MESTGGKVYFDYPVLPGAMTLISFVDSTSMLTPRKMHGVEGMRCILSFFKSTEVGKSCHGTLRHAFVACNKTV